MLPTTQYESLVTSANFGREAIMVCGKRKTPPHLFVLYYIGRAAGYKWMTSQGTLCASISTGFTALLRGSSISSHHLVFNEMHSSHDVPIKFFGLRNESLSYRLSFINEQIFF